MGNPSDPIGLRVGQKRFGTGADDHDGVAAGWRSGHALLAAADSDGWDGHQYLDVGVGFTPLWVGVDDCGCHQRHTDWNWTFELYGAGDRWCRDGAEIPDDHHQRSFDDHHGLAAERRAGIPYSQTLTATGGTGSNTWSLASGSLPAGLSLSAAGVISGTPSGAGSTFTVQVADGVQTAQKSLTITINGALTITTVSLPDGVQGIPYSQTLTATGGTGSNTWSLASGSFPAGLSLSAAGVSAARPLEQDQRSPCRWPMGFKRRRNP